MKVKDIRTLLGNAEEKIIKEEKRKKIMKGKIESYEFNEEAKKVYPEKLSESLILVRSSTEGGVEHKWNCFKQSTQGC